MADVTIAQETGVPGGDISVHNYSGSDIATGLGVLWDATAANARGITMTSNGGGVVGTCGVTIETIKAGKNGLVRRRGVARMTAYGAITRGNWVRASDTSGHLGQAVAVAAAGTSASEVLGQALDTAADGEEVAIDLDIQFNHT